MNSKLSEKKRFIPPGTILPFILVTALFMYWGIPANLNDVLIKQFMKSFEISRFQAGLIQSAFYMGYFLLAMPAALLMRKFNYKTGLITGLFLFSIGCYLFWPAALAGKYSFFLFALFVIAAGLSFLETGANPFIASLGNPETSERRLNFSQSFYPLGAVIGALAGTLFIFSGIEHNETTINAMKAAGEYDAYLKKETLRVVTPYMVLATIVLAWGIFMLLTKFPKIHEEKNDYIQKGKLSDLFKYPHFWKGVLGEFFYVGAQVCTWSYFITYIQDYTGQPEKIAGGILTGTLVAFGVGRFFSTWIMKYFKPNKMMGVYAICNMVLVGIGIVFPGWIGVGAIFLTSFFMSLMFPTTFALSIKGLGPNTKLGGSLLVMAIIGGAVFTPIMGLVSQITGSMALAMIVPFTGYVYMVYYAYRGCRMKGEPVFENNKVNMLN